MCTAAEGKEIQSQSQCVADVGDDDTDWDPEIP
jgi:hypothetical protein